MSTPAVFDGDEVWDFGESSEEEDIDSDVLLQGDEEDEERATRSATPLLPASSNFSPPDGAMAALIGRLRCDNLELRKALVEAQREAEAASMAFQREQAERRRLQMVLEQAARSAAEAAAGAESSYAQLAAEESALRALLAPVAEGTEVDSDELEEEEEEPSRHAPVPAVLAREAATCERNGSAAADANGSEAVDADVSPGSAATPCEESERSALEKQLVNSKIRCAQAVERAEGLEALVEHYQSQLKALNPAFAPADLKALERSKQKLPKQKLSSRTKIHSNVEDKGKPEKERSEKPRSGKHSIKKWAGRMFRKGSGDAPAAGDAESQALPAAQPKLPSASEDLAQQREVISCLMAELEKANQKLQGKKVKSKRAGRKEAKEAMEAKGATEAKETKESTEVAGPGEAGGPRVEVGT